MSPDFIPCDQSPSCRCDVCHLIRESLRAERGACSAECGAWIALALFLGVVVFMMWIPQ